MLFSLIAEIDCVLEVNEFDEVLSFTLQAKKLSRLHSPDLEQVVFSQTLCDLQQGMDAKYGTLEYFSVDQILREINFGKF